MRESSHHWQSPFIEWANDVPEGWTLLVFYIRDARNKAIVPAVLEALALLHRSNPLALLSGPLAGKKGVFWLGVKRPNQRQLSTLFPRLGYSYAVDRAVPLSNYHQQAADPTSDKDHVVVRWRGEYYRLQRLYQEDPHEIRERAPDRRDFLLEDFEGVTRLVKGYRGDGRALSRRGLPVEDARLLVNLVTPSQLAQSNSLLDPFAGVGGIVIEALESGFTVYSLDIDHRLRHGLKQFGSYHLIADAIKMPFPDDTISAIATEPPYHKGVSDEIPKAFREMVRVLKIGGRLSMLVSTWQSDLLLKEARKYSLKLFVASSINRKGTQTAVLGWVKTG